jgi:hypothetical protein
MECGKCHSFVIFETKCSYLSNGILNLKTRNFSAEWTVFTEYITEFEAILERSIRVRDSD